MFSNDRVTQIKRDLHIDDRKLTVVIPTAGIGKRLKYVGAKALLALPNRETVVERQLRIIRDVFPNCDIIVVTGFESSKIKTIIKKRFHTRIVLNEQYESTSVTHSISLALHASLSNQVLIVYGDLVFEHALLQKFARQSDKSYILCDNTGQILETEVGLTHNNEIVEHFTYGINPKWGQIVYLTGFELEKFEAIATQSESNRLLAYEVFNKIIEIGGHFHIIKIDNEKLIEIDHPKDIERVNFV